MVNYQKQGCAHEDTHVKRDIIHQYLMQEQDCDPTVEVFLNVIFPAIAALCHRIFKDHLFGGVHSQLDTTEPVVRQDNQSGQKSSKYTESVFGLLDHLLKQNPNISKIASEVYIMEWLSKTTTDEQSELLREPESQLPTCEKNTSNARKKSNRNNPGKADTPPRSTGDSPASGILEIAQHQEYWR